MSGSNPSFTRTKCGYSNARTVPRVCLPTGTPTRTRTQMKAPTTTRATVHQVLAMPPPIPGTALQSLAPRRERLGSRATGRRTSTASSSKPCAASVHTITRPSHRMSRLATRPKCAAIRRSSSRSSRLSVAADYRRCCASAKPWTPSK